MQVSACANLCVFVFVHLRVFLNACVGLTGSYHNSTTDSLWLTDSLLLLLFPLCHTQTVLSVLWGLKVIYIYNKMSRFRSACYVVTVIQNRESECFQQSMGAYNNSYTGL